MILGIAVVAAFLAGFLVGLMSFKKTNEYCGRHGVTRLCPLCPATPGTEGSTGHTHAACVAA